MEKKYMKKITLGLLALMSTAAFAQTNGMIPAQAACDGKSTCVTETKYGVFVLNFVSAHVISKIGENSKKSANLFLKEVNSLQVLTLNSKPCKITSADYNPEHPGGMSIMFTCTNNLEEIQIFYRDKIIQPEAQSKALELAQSKALELARNGEFPQTYSGDLYDVKQLYDADHRLTDANLGTITIAHIDAVSDVVKSEMLSLDIYFNATKYEESPKEYRRNGFRRCKSWLKATSDVNYDEAKCKEEVNQSVSIYKKNRDAFYL
jgi:hypothetical protein